MIEYLGNKFLSVREVSEILKITEYTVRRYIKENKFKGKKIGSLWHINEEEIKNFLLDINK